MSNNKVAATYHPHTAPTPPLTPELLDRLRNTRGEHLEGMEIVSIPRAQLDALLGEVAKVAATRDLAADLEARSAIFWNTMQGMPDRDDCNADDIVRYAAYSHEAKYSARQIRTALGEASR